MADEDTGFKLTPEQLQKLRAWGAENMIYGECPSCHGDEWQAGDPVILPAYLTGGKEIVAFPMTCVTCAYLRLFSARQMGYVA